MPYLAGVHDGSKGELGYGYSVISIEAVGTRGRRLPLLTRLFSSTSPEYTSHNSAIFAAVGRVAPHVPQDAHWVFDSGFDGHNFFKRFDEFGLRYSVRLKLGGKRTLFTPLGNLPPHALMLACPRTHRHRTRKQGRSSSVDVQLGWVQDVFVQRYKPGGNVSGTGGETRYSVVFASSAQLGEEPLAILTTEDVRTAEDAARVVDLYLERWGVEEAHRFMKQGFDLEDLRALTWTGVQRMAQLVFLAYGFLAQLVHGPRAQVERVAATFRAFGPIPTYLYYRLLEGIGRHLLRTMDGGP
nr:transposase [Myxococcus xanthus]